MFKTSKIKTTIILLIAIQFLLFPPNSFAQLDDECKLAIGTNLGGLADYGTEIPFVDLMKTSRTWYTKDIGNPDAPFDSGHTDNLSYRPDGYPTHVPQDIPESDYLQKVVTIWAITDGWTAGQYTILWEGTGELSFWGSYQNLTQTGPNRIVFDYPNPIDGVLEMTIESSDIDDPIRNVRVLMPGTETTYETEPFNPVWLEKVLAFQTVRFMDWGQTNNWGETDGWNDPTLFDWDDRSQMDHYTWAYEKGVPYEMMVKLMNDFDLNGWVCVPHRASDDYMSEMAIYFRDNLESSRHLTVEYSNEIWNWIFGQTQWVHEYGCIQNGLDWPAGIVPYVQNCLDHFTDAFDGELYRITRAAGAFTGWPAISDTIVSNLTPGSFDAIAPTFYFGLTESAHNALSDLGAAATASDVAFHARANMSESLSLIERHKTEMADPRGIPLVFYEGGQHLTPHPFGVEPSYAQALLDVQRDSTMYNMYNEWFDSLRTLQVGEEPLQLNHFSLVSQRSARYGSWGMLESMDQDTAVIPAPKYASILVNMADENCDTPLGVELEAYDIEVANCYASIIWSTLSEMNSSHFVIERSTDGRNFEEVATVSASGESSEKTNYFYVDDLEFSGTYYYRIEQFDFDGSQEGLGIRVVDLDCEDFSKISIAPNPTSDLLNVYFTNETKHEKYAIFDAIGRPVLHGKVKDVLAGGQIQIRIEELPAGVYSFRLMGNTRGVGQHFVKLRD